MDRGGLETSNPEVDIQGKAGMVDTLVEIEVLQRDAKRVSRTHVLDTLFGDQHVYLALNQYQDG